MATATMSPLQRMVSTTASDFWNDSCAVAELDYAVANGGVGATSNPSIVAEVMKKEWDVWAPRVRAIRDEHPAWTDLDITWWTIEEMAARGARVLQPIWEREAGRKGRLSIQTNPTYFADADRMLEQALHFDTLAPNMQVKFPATSAGLRGIEEATYRGVSINATVSFTLPQALAVGAAVERALRRREAEGQDVTHMSPVCTLMVGRLDDWMKAVCERDDIVVDPAAPNWAGLAVFKKAYRIFQERGYRTRLLAAAYRHRLHWSELIGGDLVMTMTAQWQRRFNASTMDVRPRFDEPVPGAYVDELYALIPDFRRAYDEDGLAVADFDDYGATVRTLRAFIGSYWDLVRSIDDLLLPNPDLKR
jgi:transaldolase